MFIDLRFPGVGRQMIGVWLAFIGVCRRLTGVRLRLIGVCRRLVGVCWGLIGVNWRLVGVWLRLTGVGWRLIGVAGGGAPRPRQPIGGARRIDRTARKTAGLVSQRPLWAVIFRHYTLCIVTIKRNWASRRKKS
jgi:hypothetical protein